MIELNPASWHRLPTADEFAAATRHRAHKFTLGGLLLALAVGGSYVAFGIDSPILPAVLLVAVLLPIALWHCPRLPLYLTFAGACLFEAGTTPYPDALTDRVPLFWNINTVFQVYARANVKALPLSLLELILLGAAVFSLVRAVFTRSVNLRAGALFWPIFLYIGFMVMGWVNGMQTGGDFKLALLETRMQLYFPLAYLMAVNLVEERRQAGVLLWMMALCIGVKGILYVFRRCVTLGGMPLPEQGVGSHEEVIFFNSFVLLLLILKLCNLQKRLQTVMYVLLPFVVLGSLFCNRRAGTASIIIALPVLLLVAYRALPERRRFLGGLGLALSLVLPVYFAAFWNSGSVLAQPVQAIKSQIQPNADDAASDLYRKYENICLMDTIRAAPLLGYGYGKRFLITAPLPDIRDKYEFYDLIPHNQILWIWMRVGFFGFFAFWMMIAAIFLRVCLAVRRHDADTGLKAVGMTALAVMLMIILVSSVDMMLTVRNLLFAGVLVGLLDVTSRQGVTLPEPLRG